MAGRPAKPRTSSNRDGVIAALNANLARYREKTDRDEEERRLGGPKITR